MAISGEARADFEGAHCSGESRLFKFPQRSDWDLSREAQLEDGKEQRSEQDLEAEEIHPSVDI